jgi:hypothetical protein
VGVLFITMCLGCRNNNIIIIIIMNHHSSSVNRGGVRVASRVVVGRERTRRMRMMVGNRTLSGASPRRRITSCSWTA